MKISLILLLIALSVTPSAWSQEQKPQLRLTIDSDKKVYDFSDKDIRINISLENTGPQDNATEIYDILKNSFISINGKETILALGKWAHKAILLKGGEKQTYPVNLKEFYITDGGLYSLRWRYENFVSGTLKINVLKNRRTPLEVTINSAKKVYFAGEEIPLNINIKNVSPREISIGDPDVASNNDIYILDPRHEISTYMYRGTAYAANTVALKEGEEAHTQKNVGWCINTLGKYKFQVDYNGWEQSIRSNTLTIEVTAREISKEGDACSSNYDCRKISCSKYDSAVKHGHKPYCVNDACKCMCYECE